MRTFSVDESHISQPPTKQYSVYMYVNAPCLFPSKKPCILPDIVSLKRRNSLELFNAFLFPSTFRTSIIV